MQFRRFIHRFILTSILILMMTGCTTTVKYSQSHTNLSHSERLPESIDILYIYTTRTDDVMVIDRPPVHIALMPNIKFEIGNIIKSNAKDVYAVAMSNRKVIFTNDLDDAKSFTIHPRITNLSYGFMGETGIMNTPTVNTEVEINLLDGEKNILFSKKYKQKESHGPLFIYDAGGEIAKLANNIIANTFTKSINDINMKINKP